MKYSLHLEDDRLPRTVFYQRLREAMLASPRFESDATRADVMIPAEDTAQESNWPRFGDQASAYIRGRPSRSMPAAQAAIDAYLDRVVGLGRVVCVINAHPFRRVPLALADHRHVLVADINLQAWERALNPRTISLPALPVTVGTPRADSRSVLASFRGAASHPSRLALRDIHDGRYIVCELVARRNHARKVDATSGRVDKAYADLLADSVFAFVPRGDAHFSYRLLEVMSFGCIPIILSDGLVPPFDRTIDWSALSLTVPENAISEIPAMLARFSARRIAELQHEVVATYQAKLATIGQVVESLFDEIEAVVATHKSEEAAAGAAAPEMEALLAAYRDRARVRGTTSAQASEALQASLSRLRGWIGRLIR